MRNTDNYKAYKEKWYKEHPNYGRDKARNWYRAHPEKVKLANSQWRKKHPEYVVNIKLKTRYGITLQEKNKMLERQKGCCAICKRHHSLFKRRLDIDHDHRTGKIRSLLCNSCNRQLGTYQSQKLKFEQYLTKFKTLERIT